MTEANHHGDVSKHDFVQSLSRGLAVLEAFRPTAIERSVSEIASETGLARPTVRRVLLTLETLGYVRAIDGRYSLTTKSLELGTSYVSSLGIWAAARPHLEQLVAHTGESSGITQLDGSDVVCIAIVGAPKIVTLWAHVGTRFPAAVTAPGKVLLAGLDPDDVQRVLAIPSQADFHPSGAPPESALLAQLETIRAQGWALADEELTTGLRAIAAPIRNASGRIVAAVNVATHAGQTPIDQLMDDFLPMLLSTAERISADWAETGSAATPVAEHVAT